MLSRRLATFLIFLATVAMSSALVLASPETQYHTTPKGHGRMSDAAWDDLVDMLFVKYSHSTADESSSSEDDNNGVEPTYAHDKGKVSPLLDSMLKRKDSLSDDDLEIFPADVLDSIDDRTHVDEDDNEETHGIDVEIAIAGPELYENISDDALAFPLGDDVLMIVESDGTVDDLGIGHRHKNVRRRVEAKNERQVKLQQFERRLNSFKIRVLRKGVRKTCQCRTSTLKGCRRCGGACCHSIANGTVKCREGSRDSCRRIFGKKTKSKFKRRNSPG